MCTGLLASFHWVWKTRGRTHCSQRFRWGTQSGITWVCDSLAGQVNHDCLNGNLNGLQPSTLSLAPNISDNHAMLITVIFVIFGLFRYQYLLEVKEEGGACVEVLMQDRPLQITVALGESRFCSFSIYSNGNHCVSPSKAILFGEHAVVYGHPSVAVPLPEIRALQE